MGKGSEVTGIGGNRQVAGHSLLQGNGMALGGALLCNMGQGARIGLAWYGSDCMPSR